MNWTRDHALTFLFLVLLFGWAAFGSDAPSFSRDVLPVLEARCLACHSGAEPQGGLDLSSAEAALRGGLSGPVIQPGESGRSLLVEKIISGAMPMGQTRLPDDETLIIRRWIDDGLPKMVAATERDALSIFQMRCVVCHGKRKQEGGLDLRTQVTRLKGGVSGAALVPGRPDESLIIQRIASGDMPPAELLFENSVRPPTAAELETLRQWIAAGAQASPPRAAASSRAAEDPLVSDEDRRFWSFQPPKRWVLPRVTNQSRVRTPIDAFLLSRLEDKGLGFSEEAPSGMLVRRAYIAVTGMPPTPAESAAFLEDSRPDRYARLVDRLLSSPQYGERWGRYWMDAVGYADSEGKADADPIRPQAWRYRDYVIRSLNDDKPYDQFLREQVAGDEMVDYRDRRTVTPEELEKLVATGFWRTVPDGTYSLAQSFLPERMNVIADAIEVLGSAVLGVTISCSRCHDHKYDPIPQHDYYRLSAILQTSYDPYDWIVPTRRHLDVGLPEQWREAETHNAPTVSQIARIKAQQKEREAELRARFGLDEKTTTKGLITKAPEYLEEARIFFEQLEELKKRLLPIPHARALYELGGEPSRSYLLRRGDALSPGEEVQPGVLSVLSTGLVPYRVIASGGAGGPVGDASGRRTALARWLTQPNHPLTSRVIVNRIWMHYFDRGIVPTPDNFGRSGSLPSHPELLDWLATELPREGWSLKAIHRLILNSSAFRQTSRIAEGLEQKDPENILISRMPMRRMDADSLYDSILKVTGRLDPTPFGLATPIEVKSDGEVVPEKSEKGWRRSVYVLRRRLTPVTMLETFDLPPMSPNCIERSESTVPTQALQLMNSAAVIDHARHLAGRVLDYVPADSRRQIDELYRRVLARPATWEEIERGLATLQQLKAGWRDHLTDMRDSAPRARKAEWMALSDVGHTLLNSAEFVYVD